MSLVVSILRGGSNSHQTTSEEANGPYTDFVSQGIVGTVGNTSGVAPATGGFAVNATGTPDTNINVSAGVAYVTGTPTSQNSQTFRVKNSATSALAISANASGSTKYDWVYVKLDATNLNTPNTAGDNVATIVASRSSSAATDDGTPPTYGYAIAVVTVANGFSTITNSVIRDVRSQTVLNTGSSNATDGWVAAGEAWTVSTGYNTGQKEHAITISGDKTAKYSKGMRVKVVRGTTPPTQCTDLESSSSQYASKTSPAGLSFTDDFTCEAWVKLESYTAGGIVARRNVDTEGWSLGVNSSGQLEITSLRIASNNRVVTTYQSLPLAQWVHVVATMDNSGTTYTTYINGAAVANTAVTTGTITALVQGTTALVVGALKSAGTSPFDGKIADVRVWSAIRTATQIRDNMNQQLVGNESNLVSYFKLDGSFTDSTSNANTLTGQNSAVATNVDNPMNATEYGIITGVSYSAPNTTLTVFTGTDYNIPNITLSTPYYSSQKAPFGFVAAGSKWVVETLIKTRVSNSSTINVFQNLGHQLSVPTGEWYAGYAGSFTITHAGATFLTAWLTLSSGAATESDPDLTTQGPILNTSLTELDGDLNKRKFVSLTTQTLEYLNIAPNTASSTVYIGPGGTVKPTTVIRAECAYV